MKKKELIRNILSQYPLVTGDKPIYSHDVAQAIRTIADANEGYENNVFELGVACIVSHLKKEGAICDE